MRKPHVGAQFCFLLLLLMAVTTSVLAQSNKASLVGTVKDPNEALVKGAKITVTNTATGETREVTSGDEGTYTVTNLDPGKYKVTVDAPIFSRLSSREL